MSLFNDLNQTYLQRHTTREDAFWANKMGLSTYTDGDFEKHEFALKDFITDASWLPKIREELKRTNLTETEQIGLNGWLKFFEANAIESEEAKALQKKIIEMEGELYRARGKMKLGYIDPETGEFVEASSVQLRLIIQTDASEAKRKAAWEGLRSIETYVLEHGFAEIVKQRNRLGRLLGYKDFYDYRVKVNEGFSKENLFELLDELEVNTREACKASVERIRKEKGDAAAQAWNFEQATAGDLKAEKDPYMGFDTAFERWGRSFAALGIGYRGATLTLDLVGRKGKYENGFMHGPGPSFMDGDTWRPARINFTSFAVPGQIGSGQNAAGTLFHEGGHAAHFSNIRMPAPCFSQEFAPTSIAFAETQSMFLDSLVNDPDWLTRYALDKDGNAMPFDLIEKVLEEDYLYRANLLRKLMVVPYFERRLYDMADEELTAENILKAGREIEKQMVYMDSDSRPILAIPHLLDSESSAYYHAYVLAQMAVYQTRAYFIKEYGYILDNPQVGPALAEHYWKPGNSKDFLTLVAELVGEPFSAKATIDLVNKDMKDVIADAKQAIDRVKTQPAFEGPVNLDATIKLIHGDEVIASTEDGTSFEDAAKTYGAWIRKLEE